LQKGLLLAGSQLQLVPLLQVRLHLHVAAAFGGVMQMGVPVLAHPQTCSCMSKEVRQLLIKDALMHNDHPSHSDEVSYIEEGFLHGNSQCMALIIATRQACIMSCS
jgi:hypothetical protein